MDPTTKDIVTSMLGSLIRHGLTTAAGILVAKGALDSAQSANFVQIGYGIALFGLGWAWSLLQKYLQAKHITGLQDALDQVMRVNRTISAPPTLAVGPGTPTA